MTFLLKKIVSAFLLPLPLGLLWVLTGIILLIANRAIKTRMTCFITGFFIITLFSLNPISVTLLNSLQSKYAPLLHPPDNVTQVIVLGGGVSGGKNYPPNLTLNSASLSRLVEGVRLFNALQTHHVMAQLILSGGRVFQSPAVAGKMRNTAVMLGVDQKNIVLENGSRDTREEALFLKKMVGQNPFILVTSAYHMPRAMALFENAGMHPIAAPTQFLNSQCDTLFKFIPSTNNLIISDMILHEYGGMWWAKIRGYIGK